MKKNSITDQLKQMKHGQQIFAIIILIFVLVLSWIFVEIFSGQQQTKISPALTKAALPLTPQLDTEVLTEIEEKRVFTAQELENFPIYKVISINRGKEQTVVPISVDSADLEEDSSPGSGASLSDIVPQTDQEATPSSDTP